MTSKRHARGQVHLEYNAWDKVVGFFSPGRAIRQAYLRGVMRHTQDEVGSGRGGRSHHASSRSRKMLKRYLVTNGSADADSLLELDLIRERSRDAVRNMPLAAGAISSTTCAVVGSGIVPRSQIDQEILGISDKDASEWGRKAERFFSIWANSTNADSTRVQNFHQLSNLAFRSALENGDVFAIWKMAKRPNFPFESTLKLIEADRCDNPGQGAEGMASPVTKKNLIWGGVEKTKNGVPTAYWFMREHPGQLNRQDRRFFRVRKFAANGEDRIVLHLFDRLRVDQSRGIPWLAPVFEALKKLSDYSESELTAALVSSFFTVFLKSESNEGFADPFDPDGSTDESEEGEILLGAGAIAELGPGDDIEIANPNRPNSQYEPFVKAQLREIGVGLGVPVEVLLKAFESSYSSARASLLEAWRFFMDRRKWITTELHTPAWRRVITEAVAKGFLEAPGFFEDAMKKEAWLNVKWIGPAAGQIRPEIETKAARSRIDAGLSTIDDETAAINGGDFRKNHTKRASEFAMRLADGLETPPEGRPAIAELPEFEDDLNPEDPDDPEATPVDQPEEEPEEELTEEPMGAAG